MFQPPCDGVAWVLEGDVTNFVVRMLVSLFLKFGREIGQLSVNQITRDNMVTDLTHELLIIVVYCVDVSGDLY